MEVVLDRNYYEKNSQEYNISAKIFGIRQKVDDKQLIQIELDGKNELSLQFGECAFNGLKFKDTSSIYKVTYSLPEKKKFYYFWRQAVQMRGR